MNLIFFTILRTWSCKYNSSRTIFLNQMPLRCVGNWAAWCYWDALNMCWELRCMKLTFFTILRTAPIYGAGNIIHLGQPSQSCITKMCWEFSCKKSHCAWTHKRPNTSRRTLVGESSTRSIKQKAVPQMHSSRLGWVCLKCWAGRTKAAGGIVLMPATY